MGITPSFQYGATMAHYGAPSGYGGQQRWSPSTSWTGGWGTPGTTGVTPDAWAVDPYTGQWVMRGPFVASPMTAAPAMNVPIGYLPVVRQSITPGGGDLFQPAVAASLPEQEPAQPISISAPAQRVSAQKPPVSAAIEEATLAKDLTETLAEPAVESSKSPPPAKPEPQPPKDYADAVGQRVGRAVATLLRENPELEAKLKTVNLDALLQNPEQLVGGLRDSYQKSRVLRWLTNRYGKQAIKALPDNLEPSALQALDWLNGQAPAAIG